MRFIVDFYRYVILAGIALMIVGVVYVALELNSSDSPFASYTSGGWLALGIVAIALFVMSLGMVATFISLHDRHIEIAQEIRALRMHLESRE